MTLPVSSIGAPALDAEVLSQRLESLRQSLGADRLGVARRLQPAAASSAPGPFELLAVVESEPRAVGVLAETRLPLEAVVEMLQSATGLDRSSGSADPIWNRRLAHWEAARVMGWALPSDRLPSVYFVALFHERREIGAVRRDVAAAGLEALAHALAPPAWMPVAACGASAESDGAPLEWSGPDARHLRLRTQWPRLRQSRAPVLIEAEAGCGAQVLAARLVGDPAEHVDCAAEGVRALDRWERREPGSLILHEPQSLTAETQLRLLSLLESESDSTVSRVLTVSRGSLWESVDRGELHPDLYWRLASLRLELAPLRDRVSELPDLFRRAWAEARGQSGRGVATLRLDARARRRILEAAWPGNVAQLRREARRIVELHPQAHRLELEMLSEDLRGGGQNIEAATFRRLLPLDQAVAAVEQLMIRRALCLCEGNKADAARRRHVSRQGLYRKLRHYGMLEESG